MSNGKKTEACTFGIAAYTEEVINNVNTMKQLTYKPYMATLYGAIGFIVVAALVGMVIERAFGIDTAIEDSIYGVIVIFVFAVLFIASYVLLYIQQYRLWKFVIERSKKYADLHPTIGTPGKAVGFQFIPFFNFYWIFKSWGQLPFNVNELAKKEGKEVRLSQGLGITIPILILVSIIPVINILTTLVNIFILIPVFILSAIKACNAMGGQGVTEPENTSP